MCSLLILLKFIQGDLTIARQATNLPTLPKQLTLEEKKYLLAVERGDLANVRRY